MFAGIYGRSCCKPFVFKNRGRGEGLPNTLQFPNRESGKLNNRMDMDKLAQRVIRPVIKAIGLPWYGWHGFRRGIASNLYELGANEKIVQRILRHANPHVTKDRYIKAFDPAVLEAMQRMQATLEVLESSPAIVQQVN